jgi:hypothetical protein
MRFLMAFTGYRRTDHIRYQIIRQELNIFNILNKIDEYQITVSAAWGKKG